MKIVSFFWMMNVVQHSVFRCYSHIFMFLLWPLTWYLVWNVLLLSFGWIVFVWYVTNVWTVVSSRSPPRPGYTLKSSTLPVNGRQFGADYMVNHCLFPSWLLVWHCPFAVAIFSWTSGTTLHHLCTFLSLHLWHDCIVSCFFFSLFLFLNLHW